MNISKKWGTAAAAVLAIALVGGGTISATAAEGDPVNPQPNGSPGAFFVYDSDILLAETAGRVFDRSEFLSISASAGDPSTEIMAADYVPAGQTYTQIYKFVTRAADLAGGANTWRAYDTTSAAGPNGGVAWDDFTLEGKTQSNGGGVDSIFSEGGEWYAGLAFTTNNGVTVLGSVYRTIHVEPGTGKFTIDAVTLEGPAPVEEVVEADLTPALSNTGLVTETVDSKVLAIDAGAANANKTLKVGSFPAGLTGQVTLNASGVGTIDASAIPAGTATKLYLAESDSTVVVWDAFTLTQTFATTDTTDLTVDVTNSGRFELVAPAATLIDLGDVRRNQTTAPVALGQFTVVDDRDVLSGWSLNVTAADFAGAGNTTVAKNALGYAPRAVALTDGVTLGAAKAAGAGAFGVLAEGIAGSSTAEVGAVLDTDLTFKAPINAAKGVHTSTLTLDLVSK